MGQQTKLRFGELEAILADINGIPSVQRTSFQARLKDIQRHGLLRMEELPKGKAAAYRVRELALMAIAVEMCQFGLSTKRAVEVMLVDEYPLWMAVMAAAGAIEGRPEVFNEGPGNTGNPPDQKMWGFSADWRDSDETDPFSMFLYFDPSVLAPWEEDGADEGEDRASATFFYAGKGVVAESIARWTTGPTRRMALINITKLIFDIAAYLGGTENGLAIVREFFDAAIAYVHRGDFDLDGWLANVSRSLGMSVAARPADPSWIPLQNVLEPDDLLGRYIATVEQEVETAGSLTLPVRQLPDMIIRLPGQRELMVDAKVIPAADIPQAAIRDRLRELADEPYFHAFADRTKFVVLYIPSEDFLSAAIAADNGLIDRALEQKVLLATPSVFRNILIEVALAWEKHREEFPDLWEEEFEALGIKPVPRTTPWPHFTDVGRKTGKKFAEMSELEILGEMGLGQSITQKREGETDDIPPARKGSAKNGDR